MSDEARAHLHGLLAWHRAAPRDVARMALLGEPGALYAIVDLARDPELVELLGASGEAYCALDETREPDDLGETAPTVVRLTPGAESLAALLEDTWGLGSTVYFTSDEPFPAAYRRVLLRAGVDPARAAPRFWEPASLRALLDAGDASLFEAVRAWLVETTDGGALARYRLADGRVARDELPLSGAPAPAEEATRPPR